MGRSSLIWWRQYHTDITGRGINVAETRGIAQRLRLRPAENNETMLQILAATSTTDIQFRPIVW